MSGCSDCGSASGAEAPEEFGTEKQNELSSIKRVIGVVSGKGGVGKSLVTGLLASAMSRKGYKVGVLDADITGPSIPKIFGVGDHRLTGVGNTIFPAETANGVKVMSINLVLEDETDPVIWRGPVLGNVIKQFWSEVGWGEIDYLFVDMPPGTGDVALTVFQSLPVDGLVIVTSPQDLVSMIVAKAVKMADTMSIPVLGLVENMSYLSCPSCDERIEVFGKSHVEETAKSFRLPVLGRLPIDPEIAQKCDAGDVESVEVDGLDDAIEVLEGIEAHDVPTVSGEEADGEA